jgi:hypothetical protein
MDINTIRTLKTELERELEPLITNFLLETNLSPEDIRIEIVDDGPRIGIGNRRVIPVVKVAFEI